MQAERKSINASLPLSTRGARFWLLRFGGTNVLAQGELGLAGIAFCEDASEGEYRFPCDRLKDEQPGVASALKEGGGNLGKRHDNGGFQIGFHGEDLLIADKQFHRNWNDTIGGIFGAS